MNAAAPGGFAAPKFPTIGIPCRRQSAKIGRRPPERDAQIRTSHVADEERVACEDRLRLGRAAVEIVDDDGNRFGGVARGLEGRQPHSSELDHIAIADRRERVFGSSRGAEIDRGAGPIAQFEMTCDEVGVEVCEQDVLDLQAVLRSERQVLVDVPLRIDDGRRVCQLVTNEVRRVREAIQIKLLQDHRCR